MKLIQYPWFFDDYLSSPWVMAATLEEEGIYRRLLDYQMKHPGCKLPDDPQYLRRLCKGAKWTKIHRILEANFVREETQPGVFFWKNLRNYSEFCRIFRLSEKQRDKANYRWDKEKALASAMPVHMPETCQPEPEPEPEPIESKPIASYTKKPVSYSEDFERWFTKLYPHRNGERHGKSQAWIVYSQRIKGEDIKLLENATANFSNSKKVRDGYSPDPIRFLVAGKGKEKVEPWRDYINADTQPITTEATNNPGELWKRKYGE